MKKTFLVGIALVLLFLVVETVSAAGLFNSTTYTLPVIGENVELRIERALIVETKWTGIAIPFTIDESTPVFPGQVIGEGEITIENISPITQGAQLSARPIKAEAEWPWLEIITNVAGKTYQPWEVIILEPGSQIEVYFQVKVTYGSPLAIFHGMEVVVDTVPPPSPPSLDGGLG